MKKSMSGFALILIMGLALSLAGCGPRGAAEKETAGGSVRQTGEELEGSASGTEGRSEDNASGTEKSAEDNTSQTEETLSLVESVTESVRAKLDYTLTEEDIAEITERIGGWETNRRVEDLKQGRTSPQPGTYAFRVYADISDDTLFAFRRPFYYVWMESSDDSSGQKKESCYLEISNRDTGWWHSGGFRYFSEEEVEQLIPLHEGNYVLEDTDELQGKNFEGKEELLSTFWKLALKNIYNGGDEMLSLNPEYHISACIRDFTKYSDPDVYVDVFYNWSIRQTGGLYNWADGEIAFTWMKPEELTYSVSDYRESLNNSAVLMDGTVTKSWNEEFQKMMDNETKKGHIPYLCGAMLEIVGQRYLDKTGSIYGNLTAELYLVDSDFTNGLPKGEFWLCFPGEKPVHVSFKYKIPVVHQETAYTYTVDEENEMTSEIAENACLTMKIDLTTERPEKGIYDFPNEKTDYFEGSGEGFLDEYLPERYPSLDYDGDGLIDRIYRRKHESKWAGQIYLRTGSGEEIYLGDALDRLTFGFVERLDVTGDGTPELIYYNPNFGASGPMVDYYGIWTVGSDGWERIPVSDTAEEEERLAGLFPDVPLKVEKLSDTKLKITQTDRQSETVLELKPGIMDRFWPVPDGQAAYIILDSSVKVKIDGEHEGLYGTVRIGRADLIGKWMYLDGEWKITEFYLNIVEGILS